jgi:hypothetical protein
MQTLYVDELKYENARMDKTNHGMCGWMTKYVP